jgi:hypothetical protein
VVAPIPVEFPSTPILALWSKMVKEFRYDGIGRILVDSQELQRYNDERISDRVMRLIETESAPVE